MTKEQQLIPFADEPQLRSISFKGKARWSGGKLELQYKLVHGGSELIIPSVKPAPERCDGLWQHTCFEAFVSQPGHQGYWEINLSPSGDWNFYKLTTYRENLQPEDDIQQVPFTVEQTSLGLELRCIIPLDSVLDAELPVELSLTAVLEHSSEGCSYWAWKHSGKEADFHLRDSFTLLAPEETS